MKLCIIFEKNWFFRKNTQKNRFIGPRVPKKGGFGVRGPNFKFFIETRPILKMCAKFGFFFVHNFRNYKIVITLMMLIMERKVKKRDCCLTARVCYAELSQITHSDGPNEFRFSEDCHGEGARDPLFLPNYMKS